MFYYNATVAAHQPEESLSQQTKQWLLSLGEQGTKAHFSYSHEERSNFQWVPAARAGVPLKALNEKQRHGLRDILQRLLSGKGAVKVDAIIAAEAALGVLTRSPDFRDPGKYYTAVFGDPGAEKWMLRFEGHHLSVNLNFKGENLVSATPLFVGVNPETIPQGPDKGLRPLSSEIDIAKKLYLSLSEKQRKRAVSSKEWFAGFLTDAGTRRAKIGKPIGIPLAELNSDQQQQLKALINSYISTINAGFASKYLDNIWQAEKKSLHFFWQGKVNKGEDFYYRVNGKQLLIEMETVAGATHIHAVWRDAKLDFAL